jgi:hypothetical protein
MLVTAVLDAIKKRGMFKDYEKAQKAYVEVKKAVELVEAGLALLNGTSAGSKKNCKKRALVKAKEAVKEAFAKTPETKSETKEAEEATNMTNNAMKAGFQADLDKAKKAIEDAKGAMTAEASQMFVFYSNLLFPESKYSWNKMVSEQTESNPSQEECLASCLIIASWFTCSLRFPSTWQSKKSTTSPMYLRSPSTSVHISLYVV